VTEGNTAERVAGKIAGACWLVRQVLQKLHLGRLQGRAFFATLASIGVTGYNKKQNNR
jgi:hypothetical protein